MDFSFVAKTIAETLAEFMAQLKEINRAIRQRDKGHLLFLHQAMLFVLTASKLLRLKSGESYAAYSSYEVTNELLISIGSVADVIEFATETLEIDDREAMCNTTLHYILWAVWSWSLLQYIFVPTIVESPGQMNENTSNSVKIAELNKDKYCARITLLFQDGPFFVCRIYFMLAANLMWIDGNRLNQMLLFFTMKNLMVLILLWWQTKSLTKEIETSAHTDLSSRKERSSKYEESNFLVEAAHVTELPPSD